MNRKNKSKADNRTSKDLAARAKAQYTFFHVKEDGPLMEYLMKQMDGISRTSVKSMLSNRRVMVDNRFITQFDYPLVAGMKVQISKNKNNKEFKSPFVKLLYEDRYLLVIEKKENIPVIDKKEGSRSVMAILSNYVQKTVKERRVFFVHNLDKEASGLMVFAKDEKTKFTLQDYWDEILRKQKYVAVVSGSVEKDNGAVSSWFDENHELYLSNTALSNNRNEKSITYYKTIKRANHFSLIEIESTQNNQVKMHLKNLGNPIVGDVKGGNNDNPLGRLALHAFQLNFYHPITGEELKFETTYPSAFKGLLVRQNNPEKVKEEAKTEENKENTKQELS
ncbi:MAG: RluA family pseudouridine synthase [Bacteroidaceae bacterium]|nr:RluA family pseudouridine synthase [Bacteroidaceae bacterium]